MVKIKAYQRWIFYGVALLLGACSLTSAPKDAPYTKGTNSLGISNEKTGSIQVYGSVGAEVTSHR